MMRKRAFLFSVCAGVSLFCLSGGAAEAACIQTPTCSSLGYTSTSSCTGGVKCPFGNYWNCTASEIKTELTNKITELEKIIEELKQNSSSGGVSNCQIGDILYSDKTCSADVVNGKTPIGVVFDGKNKLAIGLNGSSSTLEWSTDNFDVPALGNIMYSLSVTADLQGKNNTRIILEYCQEKRKSCPAVENANRTTQAGDWYLPAMGELYAIYNNKDVLNIALSKIGEKKLGSNYYWSSSEGSNNGAWILRLDDGYVNDFSKNNYYYVRPVLAF